MQVEPKVIVALDFDNASAARTLVDQLDPTQCALKIGKELFTVAGPSLVREFVARDFRIFLDLKFHDIPQTVAKACAAAADLGVWMMNVHALGGVRMMEAARAAVGDETLLIAVTVLTSMEQADLRQLGLQENVEAYVQRFASLAHAAGLNGVVCSSREAGLIKSSEGASFLTVTPGIRPANSVADDQRRIMTPQQALQNGADYLVIGRPVTQAEDPLAVLQQINRDIASLT